MNGDVHHRSALVVRPSSVEAVQAVVRAARATDLELSVRGGGYDWAGRAIRGALVVDLSQMRHVTIRKDGPAAVVGGGATVSDVLDAAGAQRLSATTGTVGAVGMAGLSLGGGYGRLLGRAGLASDNILAAQVVLADGRVVVTDETHEPELLVAISASSPS